MARLGLLRQAAVTEVKQLIAIHIGIALLLISLSIPLILRKVPMNSFYGVRFAQSFKSKKNWYDINAVGGKILAAWALPILAWGIVGFFLRKEFVSFYSWWGNAIVIGCVLIACAQSYWAARKIDRKNSPQIKIDSQPEKW